MAKYAFVFIIAALLSTLITPVVRVVATWAGVLDQPGERRIHTGPIPRLGGIAVFAAFAIVVSLVLLGLGDLSAVLRGDDRLPFYAIGLALVIAVGIVDDVRSLSPWSKLAVEVVAATLVACTRPDVPGIWGTWFGYGMSILWIVAVTNAFNLIDGLDGLAAGLGVIVSTTLVCISVYSSNQEAAVLLAILAGSLAGFLRHNFHPSKIFLGDSGSLALGFLLASISIDAASRLSAFVAIFVPVLAMGVPLIETGLTASRRLLRTLKVIHHDEETGHYRFDSAGPIGLFTADREHIHHRLIDLGLSHRGAVVVLYGACSTFCAIAFLLVAFRTPFDAIFVAAFGLATLVGIRQLQYGEMHLLRNGTLLPIFEMPLVNQRLLQVLLDLSSITLSYFVANLVTNDFAWDYRLRFHVLLTAPAVVLAQFVALWASGIYRGSFRYTGFGDALIIGRGLAAATIAGWLAILVAGHWEWPRISLVLLDGYLLATFVGGARLAFGVLDFIFKRERSQGTRVLIYGVGRSGVAALQEIQSNRRLAKVPIGFVDDQVPHRNHALNGYPVHSLRRLGEMISRQAFDELIMASNRIDSAELSALTERCTAEGISVTRFVIEWQSVQPIVVPEETVAEHPLIIDTPANTLAS